MPRTPPRHLPARPLTIPCACQPRKRIKDQKQRQALFVEPSPCSAAVREASQPSMARLYRRSFRSFFRYPRMPWIYRVDQGRHLPRAAENCRRRGESGCGGVSAMGPRHASGGLGRTPNPGLAVCAGQRTRARRDRAYRDVFTAPPATGPTPPTHGKPAFDLASVVAVVSAGAGRSPASTNPSLLQEIVHQQMLHVVESAVQHRLGRIQRRSGHLLGLDLRRHHQLGAAGMHVQQRRATL